MGEHLQASVCTGRKTCGCPCWGATDGGEAVGESCHLQRGGKLVLNALGGLVVPLATFVLSCWLLAEPIGEFAAVGFLVSLAAAVILSRLLSIGPDRSSGHEHA